MKYRKSHSNTYNNRQYEIALNKLKLYKKKYYSFNNVDNFDDAISIDFFAERVAKFRHYTKFFPELLER